MEQYYLVLLAFLGVIAVIDLFVGVSNDAVNFLNSALGCRISSFRTTLWVASIGVLAGATFSSGMMEIARSGVFHPQLFTFSELMIVFFAVMVADVILLDAFNSLGLPTSTTVSIVFLSSWAPPLPPHSSSSSTRVLRSPTSPTTSTRASRSASSRAF